MSWGSDVKTDPCVIRTGKEQTQLLFPVGNFSPIKVSPDGFCGFHVLQTARDAISNNNFLVRGEGTINTINVKNFRQQVKEWIQNETDPLLETVLHTWDESVWIPVNALVAYAARVLGVDAVLLCPPCRGDLGHNTHYRFYAKHTGKELTNYVMFVKYSGSHFDIVGFKQGLGIQYIFKKGEIHKTTVANDCYKSCREPEEFVGEISKKIASNIADKIASKVARASYLQSRKIARGAIDPAHLEKVVQKHMI